MIYEAYVKQGERLFCFTGQRLVGLARVDARMWMVVTEGDIRCHVLDGRLRYLAQVGTCGIDTADAESFLYERLAVLRHIESPQFFVVESREFGVEMCEDRLAA